MVATAAGCCQIFLTQSCPGPPNGPVTDRLDYFAIARESGDSRGHIRLRRWSPRKLVARGTLSGQIFLTQYAFLGNLDEPTDAFAAACNTERRTQNCVKNT